MNCKCHGSAWNDLIDFNHFRPRIRELMWTVTTGAVLVVDCEHIGDILFFSKKMSSVNQPGSIKVWFEEY